MQSLNSSAPDFLLAAESILLSGGEPRDAIELLARSLYKMRQQLPFDAWKEFATVDYRQHSLMKVLQEDPFIWRAFNKPRGYAGDGEILDFIFAPEDGFQPQAVQEASELGQRLYAYTAQTEVPRAVRARRRCIVERINDTVERTDKPHILSLACGHLPEARYITALRDGRIGRFVAMDQDKQNLATVEREFGSLGVVTLTGSVREMLKGLLPEGEFDFIYAAGLYDYLAPSVAQRITEILFARLHPGGRLFLANYLPGIAYAGFIEAILDWWLIYRSKPELLSVAETLPQQQVASYRIAVEEEGNIAMLEIERR